MHRIRIALLVSLAAILSLAASAQVQSPVVLPPTDLTNIYAAGVSFNNGATASLAGTALYAHRVTDNSGTYAFTALDAVPNTLKPFVVNTNIGVGIAQRIVTIGKVPVFIPTAAGISWNGTNTGWQWNTGALASVHLKGQYYIMPTVRLEKSSVSNGDGYQPIVGVLFAWGQ